MKLQILQTVLCFAYVNDILVLNYAAFSVSSGSIGLIFI